MPIKLTKKEADIYPYFFSGRSNAELAFIFDINRVNMSHHISKICLKKGVASRIELMANEILRLKGGLNEYEM
jgi:DNA-binding NarL/FixJ family response regulator